MRILIVGLGSIGRKHFSILNKIEGVEIAALRTRKGTLKESVDIKEYDSFKSALEFNPDGVIISNPTSMHVKTALPFVKNGIKVLIEKPISVNLEELQELEPYERLIRSAYCLRFLDIYNFLHDRFASEKPFKIGFKRSYYLPNWHPYADYKKEYTARKELGGGVIRTLSHEIDIAIHWLGEFKTVKGSVDKISFLDIDVDDYAFFSMKSTNYECRVNFELDFFSPKNINIGEAFTEKGKYEWDLGQIEFQPYNGEKEIIYLSDDKNMQNMYKNQIHDYLNWIKGEDSKNTNLNEAKSIIKIIEKVEKG